MAEHFRLAHRGETLDMAAAFRYFPALEQLTTGAQGCCPAASSSSWRSAGPWHARPRLLTVADRGYVLSHGEITTSGDAATLKATRTWC